MKKNTKIIIGAACASVLIAGAGAGCYYTYIQQQGDIVTELPTETQTETQTEMTTAEPVTTETPTETTTEKETEPPTTAEPETPPEPETGTITTGELPSSPDDFIIVEDADQFFEHSVFIGDSVMMGFRNYVMGQPQGFLGGPQFLVSGSFSVRMALNKISETTIHPIYQGEQHYIWDSISMMGAEKAFLFFGLNDIDMEGVDGTRDNYIEVIDRIKETSPKTEIYIISTTNMLTGSERGGLNNDNIRLLNDKMKEYCAATDVQYIDIASFLTAEDGGLKPEFCSDAYVHQTYAAYEVWTKVLRGYASGGNYRLPEEPETTEETETTVGAEDVTTEKAVTEASQAEAESTTVQETTGTKAEN
ncbi:MAG: hypothetical protein J6B06_03515 [Lachnospiraceae bacterium]|nr:hypothetical protein [Lachnospiraceae bacterium]